MDHINWYPGHMKKTRELIRDNLKLCDMVIEVIDARIPVSSRNPIIDELVGDKPRIIVLNKQDLADPEENRKWIRKLSHGETQALELNCMKGSGVKELFALLKKEQARLTREKNQARAAAAENSGGAAGGANTAVMKNRPGVTKGKQWLSLPDGMQLLDTPGILWPKFEDQQVGRNLAYCGSIKDEILDIADLALEFIGDIQKTYPEVLTARYKLEELAENPLDNMEEIARKRGFILPGKRIDYERCARTVMDEFRSGKLGRITLEKAE